MTRRADGRNSSALFTSTSITVAAKDLTPRGVVYARSDAYVLFRRHRHIRRTPFRGCRSLLSGAAVTLALLTAGLFGIAAPQPAQAAASPDPECDFGATSGFEQCDMQDGIDITTNGTLEIDVTGYIYVYGADIDATAGGFDNPARQSLLRTDRFF
jgi:hypothetical protein